MRLFTGIGLPENIVDNLARLLDQLRPVAHLKWSAPYNLHITTKFIGNWPEDRLEEMTSTLRPLSHRNAIAISISGIGWLPNPKSPRVFYAGVKAGPDLTQLASDTDEALAPLGVERETRKFSPHLTLARVKDSAVPLGPLREAIDNLKSLDFGHCTASSFYLYLSKPGPAGSIYTQLAEFPFSK
jgi:2'-5' RNA ligase